MDVTHFSGWRTFAFTSGTDALEVGWTGLVKWRSGFCRQRVCLRFLVCILNKIASDKMSCCCGWWCQPVSIAVRTKWLMNTWLTTLLGQSVRHKKSVSSQSQFYLLSSRMKTLRLIENLEFEGIILHLWTFVYKSSPESIKEEQKQEN